MLYVVIFIIICLLTGVQFGLLESFRKPAAIARMFKTQKQSPELKIVFTVFTIVLYLLLFYALWQLSIPHPMANTDTAEEKPIISDIYSQLGHEVYPDQENYYFLYTASDKTKSTLETVAHGLKRFCHHPCTINFYDTKQAYSIDRERVMITSPAKMTTWNEKYYVFVADHYLGYLNSQTYSTFAYYPYKDLYYASRKRKQ